MSGKPAFLVFYQKAGTPQNAKEKGGASERNRTADIQNHKRGLWQ
jgi:hypothetical protein